LYYHQTLSVVGSCRKSGAPGGNVTGLSIQATNLAGKSGATI
jgi:hypothetical protein